MRNLVRHAAVVGVAIGLALTVGASGAQASGSPAVNPRWRVVYHVNLKVTNYWLFALTATSRTDAWALGYVPRNGRIASEFLEHWNGSRWRMTTVPGIAFMPQALAASGPTNVWLFGPGRAFRWDGNRWSRVIIPPNVGIGDPLVLGTADVWTTGGGSCNDSFVYHWDGTNWTRYSVPMGLEHVSGSSSRNIWVVGTSPWGACHPGRSARLVAYRWSGNSFQRVNIPAINGQHGSNVAVASPDDIWITSAGFRVIAHWTGSGWHRQRGVPVLAKAGFWVLAPDGHGGAWFGGCEHWSAGVWHAVFAADGCQETWGIAPIPASRSAWRLGIGRFGGREEGTIEINGPLP